MVLSNNKRAFKYVLKRFAQIEKGGMFQLIPVIQVGHKTV